jgi:hypothetical protein
MVEATERQIIYVLLFHFKKIKKEKQSETRRTILVCHRATLSGRYRPSAAPASTLFSRSNFPAASRQPVQRPQPLQLKRAIIICRA